MIFVQRIAVATALLLGSANLLLFAAPLNDGSAYASKGVVASAEEIERLCLAYMHDKLQTGYVRIRITHRDPGPGNEVRFEVYFDGERIRRDRWIRRSHNDVWAGPDRVIITESEYIVAPGAGLSTTIAPRAELEGFQDIRQQFRLFRPYQLGTSLSGLRDWDLSGQLLDRADRKDMRVSVAKLDGSDTLRLDYLLEQGSSVSVRFSPTQGFGVVGATMDTRTADGILHVSMNSLRKQYPDDNVWYPNSVDFLYELNGETVLDDVVVVEEARFGRVDESVFTLQKLGLRRGETVLDRRSGVQRAAIWSGENLIKAKPGSEIRVRANRVFWIFNAIVLMFAAVYAICRVRR